MNGAAAGLQYLASTDVPISPGAATFVANANPGAEFNLNAGCIFSVSIGYANGSDLDAKKVVRS